MTGANALKLFGVERDDVPAQRGLQYDPKVCRQAVIMTP